MVTRTNDIEVYENNGALLTLGNSQVVNYSNFSAAQTGSLTVADDVPQDQEWDFGEGATFNGDPATLLATGTVFFGTKVTLLGINLLTLQLSTAANVAVFASGGNQYLRYFNADGTDADPQALLDALASELVTSLTNLVLPPLLAPALRPLVNAIIADPLAFLENNTLLTFNLTASAGLPLVPCFTAGTLIMTRRGEVPVESLAVGDDVLTVDHGFCPLRWIGSRSLSAADLVAAPHMRPIRIETGALGFGLPVRPLTVSPQHRCLIRSKIAARIVGEREVLIAAKHLVETPGISVVNRPGSVIYFHLLFDQHELLFSDGAITESFYLGPIAIASVDQAARDEILELFPELATTEPHLAPRAARQFLSGHIARRLVKRSLENCKTLVEYKTHEIA